MEGNQMKMREAMEEARDALIFYSGLRLPAHLNDVKVHDVLADIETALSSPARNCDRPECATSKDAQNVWRKEDSGKTPYYEWLLAHAEKGGAE